MTDDGPAQWSLVGSNPDMEVDWHDLEITPGRVFELPPMHLEQTFYISNLTDVQKQLIFNLFHPWHYHVDSGAIVIMYDMSHESPIFQDLVNQHNKRLGFEVHVSR